MERKVVLWLVIITCYWCSSMCHETFQSFLINPADALGVNTKISGPNRYCLAVDLQRYIYEESLLILYKCQYDFWPHMYWTFETDGTLRSNGYCLTASLNFTQGSFLRMQDCNVTPRNRTLWNLLDSGVIMNPASGLALSTNSGEYYTYLTLENNTFSSFQTWRVGNDTNPSLVNIIGMNSLCLQVSDNNQVWVGECEMSNLLSQQWVLYPDGTIRPQKNETECISYDDSNRVSVMACGVELSRQRWFYTQNGTILNERDNLVMDVKQSNPSLKEIIVFPAYPQGSANQRWDISIASLKYN